MQISRVSDEYIDTLNCLENVFTGQQLQRCITWGGGGGGGIQIFHGEILKAES